jgi:hypothetical protein
LLGRFGFGLDGGGWRAVALHLFSDGNAALPFLAAVSPCWDFHMWKRVRIG